MRVKFLKDWLDDLPAYLVYDPEDLQTLGYVWHDLDGDWHGRTSTLLGPKKISGCFSKRKVAAEWLVRQAGR